MKKNLHNIRENYERSTLSESEVEENPVQQFIKWFDEYQILNHLDFNAMTLSTVGADNKPKSRIVLLKAINEGGFEFYTNYQSAKGREMEVNPWVSLNFYWPQMERQVRVEGIVEKLSRAESDEYFSSRPRGSQIGAWVSEQSKEIKGRFELEESLSHFEEKFANEVPRPEYWGGYKVIPIKMEFWQGRSNRLHDRICYEKEEENWVIKRLAP